MPFDDTADRKESHKAIGLRLQLAREVLGYTDEKELQGKFAEDAGIEANTYNQYERGKSRPDLERGKMLCKTYGLSLDYIYLGRFDGLTHQLATKIKAVCAARKAAATAVAPTPLPSATVVDGRRRRKSA